MKKSKYITTQVEVTLPKWTCKASHYHIQAVSFYIADVQAKEPSSRRYIQLWDDKGHCYTVYDVKKWKHNPNWWREIIRVPEWLLPQGPRIIFTTDSKDEQAVCKL